MTILTPFLFILLLFLGVLFLVCLLFPHYIPSPFLYPITVMDLIVRNQLTRWFPSFNQSWWHEVFPRLYLGGILMADRNHLEQIKSLGIGSIFAILEEKEALTETFFSVPLKESDWQKAEIAYQRLSCPDMHAMELEEIEQAVEWVDQNISAGKAVYIHCKAGRGRSAMIVIAYLIRYHGMEYKDALQYLSQKRSVIRFRPCQLKRLKEFANQKGSKK